MTDLRDVLPGPGRTNATPLLDSHPGDHNAIVDAINVVANRVDDLETTAYYRTYATLAARNADTSAHIEGMLAWAAADRTLAVWHGAWLILDEPWQPFTPHLFIGTTEMGLGATPSCGYRHTFGACQFYLSSNWGVLGPALSGDIGLHPPLPPDPAANGGFGTMYVSPMADDAPVVGLGLFNGLASAHLPGMVNDGVLMIGSPLDGRVLNRDDLPPNGNFNCYASGIFPTAVYS
jgi:hypothetical protein